jgi:hypothetical protein
MEEYIQGLLRLAGVGAAVTVADVSLNFFTGTSFLSQTPGAFQAFTYIGGTIGAVDQAAWSIGRVNLGELME